jgi:hypothetical protein
MELNNENQQLRNQLDEIKHTPNGQYDLDKIAIKHDYQTAE